MMEIEPGREFLSSNRPSAFALAPLLPGNPRRDLGDVRFAYRVDKLAASIPFRNVEEYGGAIAHFSRDRDT